MFISLNIGIKIEEDNYIRSCARIRKISRSELIRRVLDVSIKNQLFLAILDDSKWEDDNEHKH